MTTPVILKKLMLVFALTLIPINGALAQLLSQANSTSSSDASLISPETGVDYKPLQNLLQQQKWRQANEKTTELILAEMKRDTQGWIAAQDIEASSCRDLKIIDDLWKHYSQGRFGFSVQFPIFIETGNKPGRLVNVEAYESFGDRVGWREQGEWKAFKGELDYSLNAPVGHLPNPRQEYQITGGRLQYVALAKKMVSCNLVSSPSPATSSPVQFAPIR